MKSASLVLIESAYERYKRARTFLQGTVRAALPIGTRVEVELGRAFVKGSVTAYGPGWMDPAEVLIVNEMTGKQRRFIATFHTFRVLEKVATIAKPEPAKKVQTSAQKAKR